ncbi:MAG: DegT/DnrJ/EryC1/StrS aminotransferase family protein [Phycisphaerales bacterium]|nr:MAG: DegT/DnrJ/EryC1/StrS aminotransferase family protein [Phycisphaerales bacterium]
MPKQLYCGPSSPSICHRRRTDGGDSVGAWFEKEQVFYAHKARVGIRWACDLLKLGEGQKILTPAYNCGSEISPLLNCGASVTLYRVDKEGQLDLEDLHKRYCSQTKAVYVTHYFGFPQPTASIRQFCDERQIPLIEDCALSLFSCDGEAKLGSSGDISIFNFPKTLPVPDGGMVLINNPDLHVDSWKMRGPPIVRVSRNVPPLIKRYVLRMSAGSNLLYPILLYILEHKQSASSSNGAARTALPDMPSNYYYDERLNDRKVSRLTERLLGTFDVATIISRRRTNFIHYLNFLSDLQDVEPLYEELPDGVCPLYFPVIVGNRGKVCQKLNDVSISAVAWWAGYHRGLPWDEYPDACFLKDNLLVLPVHQQLSELHIEFISRKLIDCVRECSA